MGQLTIGLGIVANDGQGDSVRSAFDKTNQNFAELYALAAPYVATLENFPTPHADFRGLAGFATNARKVGEGGGAGTGCPVYCDGTNWRRFSDDAIAAI